MAGSNPVYVVQVGPEIDRNPREQNLALRAERHTRGPKKILENETRVELLETPDKEGWARAKVLSGEHKGETGVVMTRIKGQDTLAPETAAAPEPLPAPRLPRTFAAPAAPLAPVDPPRAAAQAGLPEEDAIRGAKEHILHLPKPIPPPDDHFKDPTTKKGAALAFYLKKEELLYGRPLRPDEKQTVTDEVKSRIKRKGEEVGALKPEDAAILLKQAREEFEKHRGFADQMEAWLKNPASIPSPDAVPREWKNMDAGWAGLIKGVAGQVEAQRKGKFTPFVANSGPLQGDSRIIGFSNVTTAHISRAALNPFLKGNGSYDKWRESPLYNTPQHQEDVLRLFSMTGHRPDSALARVALESMGGTSNAALLFNNYAGLMAQKRSDGFDFERYPNPVTGFAAAATWINRTDKPYIWEKSGPVVTLAKLHKNYTPPGATNTSDFAKSAEGHGSLVGIAHRLYQGDKRATRDPAGLAAQN